MPTIASKIKSTKVAGKVVQERVEELKQQAKDAERALYEFKNANKLVGSGKDHAFARTAQHSRTQS